MVRINLINPKFLADQHLIAEYKEILMLLGYVRKHPKTNLNKIPKEYKLGSGHILFFKNKLIYLKKRFELIKKEMNKRKFKTTKEISLKNIDDKLKYNWKPSQKDKKIIKQRLTWKINLKPDYYRYYGKKKPKKFFIGMIKNA